MKKKSVKIISAVLAAMMLISTLTVSAASVKSASKKETNLFNWKADAVCIRLLNNTERQAVFAEDSASKQQVLNLLKKLKTKKVKSPKKSVLGKPLSGVSELRIYSLNDDHTYSYQFYEKYITVTEYTKDGANTPVYFSSDAAARKKLTEAMKKIYKNTEQKSASWLAIINPSRINEILVFFAEDGQIWESIRDYTAEMIDMLQALPVGKVKSIKTLWAEPDMEYTIYFTNGISYRVQFLNNKLRISSSDMKEVLEYPVQSEFAVDNLRDTAWEMSRAQLYGEAKANPVTAKPVIYLYPEKETQVNVRLNFKGRLTSTYPTYPQNGWTVTAQPDGILTDQEGRSYRYLFWEGAADTDWKQESGFFVKADEAEAFLENALTRLGMNELEQNDFITYWLPKLEENGESFVTFAAEQYTDIAQLTITPQPDSILRVQMLMTKVDESNRAAFEKLPQQSLPSFERTGFTIVEWGGTSLKLDTVRGRLSLHPIRVVG